MKKVFLKIIIAIAVLLVLYVVFNQLDSKLKPGEITLEELRGNPTYGLHNAFYHLWALCEPPDVDVESEETLEKYRHSFHAQSDYQKYYEEWNDEHRDYREMYRKHWGQAHESAKKFNAPYKTIVDYAGHFMKHKEEILAYQKEIAVLLKRYERMIACDVFEDFTAADLSAPIPNLLIWLNAAKQYNRFYFLHAADGNWQEGTAALLRNLEFAKKANKGSITLITCLVARGILRHTLNTLNGLMNLKDCPAEVCEQVLAGLPELEYEEYGSHPLLAESAIANHYTWGLIYSIDGAPFFARTLLPLVTQPNRTGSYAKDFLAEIVHRDKTPPYKWGTGPAEIKKTMRGFFWWLQNPGGKIMFDKYIRDSIGNLRSAVYKTHLTKAVYDMVRISAELHLNYTPDKPVPEILKGLKTYRNLMDRCSNKPYKWNEEKQLLYSIGVNRKDDNCMFDYDKLDESDYVLPCILYLK